MDFSKSIPLFLNWYKVPGRDAAATFIGSLAKRIVRDLTCGITTARLAKVFLASYPETSLNSDCGTLPAAEAVDMEPCAVSTDPRAEIARWKANHANVVETKRGTDARLKVALAALQQIYNVARDNQSSDCDARMALDFIAQVAGEGFEKATHNVPRRVWTAEIALTQGQ